MRVSRLSLDMRLSRLLVGWSRYLEFCVWFYFLFNVLLQFFWTDLNIFWNSLENTCGPKTSVRFINHNHDDEWWPRYLVKYSDYHYHDLHNDDRQNLRHWPVGQERGPCHVGAHCAWIYLIIIMNNTIDYFNEITISLQSQLLSSY